jgi:transposase
VQRRTERHPGKSDRLDARAVARFVRQEAPDLPAIVLEDVSVVLDLLTTEREAALRESVRLRNQIHAVLMQCDPEYRDHLPPLDSPEGLDALAVYTAPRTGLVFDERGASVRRLAQRLRVAVEQTAELKQQIADRTEQAGFSPLTELCGVNLLTAGILAGMLGPGQRFATDAELAAHAGVAPLEASSAGKVRHRLNSGGNRRLNAVLYRIAITQLRSFAPAQKYVTACMKRGKTKREAIRALKRYIVRAVWRLWQKCAAAAQGVGAAPAAG